MTYFTSEWFRIVLFDTHCYSYLCLKQQLAGLRYVAFLPDFFKLAGIVVLVHKFKKLKRILFKERALLHILSVVLRILLLVSRKSRPKSASIQKNGLFLAIFKCRGIVLLLRKRQYSLIQAIQVCTAPKGMVFQPFYSEVGNQFRNLINQIRQLLAESPQQHDANYCGPITVPHPMRARPPHRGLRSLLFTNSVWVL